MGMSIDYVSAGILIVAYVLSQIRALPVRVRYGLMGGAFALIGVMRLRLGAGVGINLAVTAIAFALAIYYLVRAMRSRAR